MGIDPSRGFVAIPRGLTDWEWYSEPNTARLFIHLLLTANWQGKQWQGITIHPGELVTSRAKLAKQLRMSEQSVRTALMHLQSTNCITSKAGPRYSVITINVPVTIVFNRDMLINETESITNCRNSVGLLSNRTIVEQHPWVTDAQTELARLAEEKAAQAQDSYTPTTFNT